MRFLLFIAWLTFISNGFGQKLTGKIIDLDNRQPVSFAIVAIDNSTKGTTADLDGNFTLDLTGGEKNITIHIVGYNKQSFAISELDFSKTNILKLKASDIRLLEVVVTPKENPAHEIIRNVIKNKSKHDIRNLPYYWCNTYAKTYFTLSSNEGDENFYEKDTAQFRKTKKLLQKQYLFFMESVTEKKYLYKNISQEKVLSSRVSGFKAAPFGAFASQLQSFSFYNDNIELLGYKYVNPLMEGTFKRYNFEITDTVTKGKDTTILIKFAPKKNSNFTALKGVLYIHTPDYAISTVMAEPALVKSDGTGVKIQQFYEQTDTIHWFPVQANTEILFYGAKINPDDSIKNFTSIMKGVSRLYVNQVKLDSAVKIKNRNITTLNEKGFDKKDEDFWNRFRKDSLSEKELKTYNVVDSIGKELKFDKKLKWFTALSTGKFQIGYLNLELKYLLRANEYEGFRPGIGFSTSDKLSSWASVGSYAGYGITDKQWKYGAFGRINFNRRQSNFLLMEAASEVTETAGTFFLQENNSFLSTENIRELLVSKMDKINFGKVSLNFSILNRVKTSAYLITQQRESPYGYYTDLNNTNFSEVNKFTVNETGIQFKYWPGEKFTESMGQLVSMGSKWPVFFLNIGKGLTTTIDTYKGQFDYTRIDLRIDHQWNFKIKGFLACQIQAGKVTGDVPYSFLYNNKSSRSGNYYISAEKTFETMYLNEFVSSEYAALFVAINSGRLFRNNKYSNPEFELVNNIGIGKVKHPERITLLELNDISKGFTETGLRVKNLYKSGISSFGIGVYYRYGNYTHPVPEKNIVAKFVLGFSF